MSRGQGHERQNTHLSYRNTSPGARVGEICRRIDRFRLPVLDQFCRRFETSTASSPPALSSLIVKCRSYRVGASPIGKGLAPGSEIAANCTGQVRGNREPALAWPNRKILVANDSRGKDHDASQPEFDNSSGFVKDKMAALVNVEIAVYIVEADGGGFVAGISMRPANHAVACVERRGCKTRVWTGGPKVRVGRSD